MSLPWILCIAICIIACTIMGWLVWIAPVAEDDAFWRSYGDDPHLPTDFQP